MEWPLKQRKMAYRLIKKAYGQATTELVFKDPFQLLVAVMLAAQSTDRQVNKITPQLFTAAPDAASMAALPLPQLEMLVHGVGLYRSKAKHLQQMAQILQSKHEGTVPRSFAEMEALPGVGHKTASVVLAIAFGMPTLAVDTHVFRVANRTGMASSKSIAGTEEQLKQLIPQKDWSLLHHSMWHHGHYCCRALKPLCSDCPVAVCCRYYAEQQGDPSPDRTPRSGDL